jgi:hypothetical protein
MSTKACNLPNADTDKKENPLQWIYPTPSRQSRQNFNSTREKDKIPRNTITLSFLFPWLPYKCLRGANCFRRIFTGFIETMFPFHYTGSFRRCNLNFLNQTGILKEHSKWNFALHLKKYWFTRIMEFLFKRWDLCKQDLRFSRRWVRRWLSSGL